MVRKLAIVVYAVLAYAWSLLVLAYLAGFLADAWVPKAVDDGPASPWWVAVPVDLAALALFGLQHSVMARPSFKRTWTRFVAPAIERSTYVIATSAVVVVSSTFLLGHFDLVGLRQAVSRVRGRALPAPAFRDPWLYGLVRHPLMTGFLIVFWSTPDMSAGRLLFAAGATGYILVGVRLEERDLRSELGPPYERYLERVPRFVPVRR
jgi:protein-S-isoprenylcysteine O-methyltransferase Ste14